MGFPGGPVAKESDCQCRQCRRSGFDPWVGKIPWSRKWQLAPVFLPGKFHGQRSLVGYSSNENLLYNTGNSAQYSVITYMRKESEKEWRYVGKKVKVKSLSRVWLFATPRDCSPPSFSVHGIFQARILEWVAISSSKGSSQSWDQTHISCISRQILHHRTTWGTLVSSTYHGC